MAVFVARDSNGRVIGEYSIKLRSGYKEKQNGIVKTFKPLFANFKNGKFDTSCYEVDKMDLTEKQVIERLREHNAYDKDFFEQDKPNITAQQLLDFGIRDLRDNIGDVNKLSILEQAYAKDERSTALKLYEEQYQELDGDVEELKAVKE